MSWCCDRMRDQVEYVGEDCPIASGCPDKLITFVPKFQEYGLVIHDGPDPQSYAQIAHCPWCGTRLPDSQRDRWFEELERLGIEPEEAPQQMLTDAWLQDQS